MARRQTRVLTADAPGVAAAAAILRAGGLVAFPTETVYGLGAHALDADAVRGIFQAKARPADDPLIVHLASGGALDTVAEPTPEAWRLAERFWPGPLTLVLPKRVEVPLEVTAGLPTVGVRVPAHPLAQQLIRATNLPVAAPSANLFGRPSPTRAAHVLEDLDGRIDAVLDGGPTQVGLESTIVDLSTVPPRLLRPGGIAAEDVEALLGLPLSTPATTSGPQPAPGLLAIHYAPRTPLTLIRGDGSAARDRLIEEVAMALAKGLRVGVLTLAEDVASIPHGAHVEVTGEWDNPARSAARLFEAIRSLDSDGLDVLFARELANPNEGLGRALADRLCRASRRVLDVHE
jgi:L-threonylcarbamoyladenylate synthase